jgi:hypothetical protein
LLLFKTAVPLLGQTRIYKITFGNRKYSKEQEMKLALKPISLLTLFYLEVGRTKFITGCHWISFIITAVQFNS